MAGCQEKHQLRGHEPQRAHLFPLFPRAADFAAHQRDAVGKQHYEVLRRAKGGISGTEVVGGWDGAVKQRATGGAVARLLPVRQAGGGKPGPNAPRPSPAPENGRDKHPQQHQET